jgi:hypothetical protein
MNVDFIFLKCEWGETIVFIDYTTPPASSLQEFHEESDNFLTYFNPRKLGNQNMFLIILKFLHRDFLFNFFLP